MKARAHIVIGQVWQVLIGPYSLVQLTITHMDDMRVYGLGKSGKEFGILRTVFDRGMRSAKMLLDEHGRDVSRCRARKRVEKFTTPLIETKTASDFRCTKRPRGAVTANPRRVEAFRLFQGGSSVDSLAERYGVTSSAVFAWLRLERERLEDERNLRAS
jgi:hypothetical protein